MIPPRFGQPQRQTENGVGEDFVAVEAPAMGHKDGAGCGSRHYDVRY